MTRHRTGDAVPRQWEPSRESSRWGEAERGTDGVLHEQRDPEDGAFSGDGDEEPAGRHARCGVRSHVWGQEEAEMRSKIEILGEPTKGEEPEH